MTKLAMCLGILIVAAKPAAAHDAPLSPAVVAANAPVEWLIGDWASLEDGNRLRQNLSWGPHRSYIKFSTYMQQPGKPEALHFDGIAIWNGGSKAFDYLFAVEPGSGLQEKGTIRAESDGSVVREVELTGPEGKAAQFRQVFRSTGKGKAVTSLMRRTASGWEPSFPGSDKIEMTRQPR